MCRCHFFCGRRRPRRARRPRPPRQLLIAPRQLLSLSLSPQSPSPRPCKRRRLVHPLASRHVLQLVVAFCLAPVGATGDEGSAPSWRPDDQFGAAVVALASAFAALAALAPAHVQETLDGVRAQLEGLQSGLAVSCSAYSPFVPAVARLFASAEAHSDSATLPTLRGGRHASATCSAEQLAYVAADVRSDWQISSSSPAPRTSPRRARQPATPPPSSPSRGYSSSNADVPRRGIAAAWGRGRGRAPTSASASDEAAAGSRDRRTERSRAHAERSRTHAVCVARVRTLLLSRAFACFRSATLAERAADARCRDACRAAADAIPRASWLCLSYVCRLRVLVHRRRHILGLLEMPPRPMYAYDVGYDATTSAFSFRDPCGRVSHQHPAALSSAPCTIPAYSDSSSVCRCGDIVQPLSPPPSSSVVLCPDASGAWCYYDSASGRGSWFPPDGSTPLVSRSLLVAPVPSTPPPRLDESFCTGMLGSSASYRFSHVDWITIYRDCGQRPLFAHRTTGSVREGPWIALRSTTGCAYYANLDTQVTRWFPPPLWMEGWVSRLPAPVVSLPSSPSVSVSLLGGRDSDRPFDSRALLPLELARLRVEGGAPHLHERGLPQYPSDRFDTEYTYPLACSVVTPKHAPEPTAPPLALSSAELSPGEQPTPDTALVSEMSSCSGEEADPALSEPTPEAVAWVLGRGEPDTFAELASAQQLELPPSPLAIRAALLLQRTVRAYWYACDELEQDSLALALEEYGDEDPELLVPRDSLLVLCAASRRVSTAYHFLLHCVFVRFRRAVQLSLATHAAPSPRLRRSGRRRRSTAAPT